MTDQETAAESAEAPASCPYPTTRVQLPSRGQFYDGRLPDGFMTIRPMTTQEEKILLGTQQDRLLLLDTVLKRCIVECAVPLEDMILGDKFYLLLLLRTITYGAAYSFATRCRACNTDNRVTLQLPESLKVRVLTEDDSEPFSATLPASGKVLGLRLLRVSDDAAIDRWARQVTAKGRPGEGGGDRAVAYTYRLARHIVTIDDVAVNSLDALTFCDNLLGSDSLAMREAIDEHNCGVTLRLRHSCERCGNVYEESMPFTADLFRPGARASV